MQLTEVEQFENAYVTRNTERQCFIVRLDVPHMNDVKGNQHFCAHNGKMSHFQVVCQSFASIKNQFVRGTNADDISVPNKTNGYDKLLCGRFRGDSQPCFTFGCRMIECDRRLVVLGAYVNSATVKKFDGWLAGIK